MIFLIENTRSVLSNDGRQPGVNEMLTRRTALGALAGATLATPALSQGRRQIKIATSANTTTNASFLMPKYLNDQGIDAEIVLFSSLLQRMQAVASGDVSVGAGGL